MQIHVGLLLKKMSVRQKKKDAILYQIILRINTFVTLCVCDNRIKASYGCDNNVFYVKIEPDLNHHMGLLITLFMVCLCAASWVPACVSACA